MSYEKTETQPKGISNERTLQNIKRVHTDNIHNFITIKDGLETIEHSCEDTVFNFLTKCLKFEAKY
jgi:hypothetical protein